MLWRVGILIELIVEAVAWIVIEVLGEAVGEAIGGRRARRRAASTTIVPPPPATAAGTVAPLAGGGLPSGTPPADGSGWAQPGTALPADASSVQPTGPAAQPQALVSVDASGCASWLIGLVLVVVMGGVGFWWGQRRHGIDPDEVPATLFVGLGLAAACLLLALVQVLRNRGEDVVGPPLAARALGSGWQGALLPWRWAPARLLTFAFANLALAGGVAGGFQ